MLCKATQPTPHCITARRCRTARAPLPRTTARMPRWRSGSTSSHRLATLPPTRPCLASAQPTRARSPRPWTWHGAANSQLFQPNTLLQPGTLITTKAVSTSARFVVCVAAWFVYIYFDCRRLSTFTGRSAPGPGRWWGAAAPSRTSGNTTPRQSWRRATPR